MERSFRAVRTLRPSLTEWSMTSRWGHLSLQTSATMGWPITPRTWLAVAGEKFTKWRFSGWRSVANMAFSVEKEYEVAKSTSMLSVTGNSEKKLLSAELNCVAAKSLLMESAVSGFPNHSSTCSQGNQKCARNAWAHELVAELSIHQRWSKFLWIIILFNEGISSSAAPYSAHRLP